MAVYGIGENKCLKEVVAKDNLFVFSESFPVAGKAYETGHITVEELGETYEDWNPSEWVVVSAMGRVDTGAWQPARFAEGAPNNTTPDVNLLKMAGQGIAAIIRVYNPMTATKTCAYKIVLMKVK